jgi:hypothetical protein
LAGRGIELAPRQCPRREIIVAPQPKKIQFRQERHLRLMVITLLEKFGVEYDPQYIFKTGEE